MTKFDISEAQIQERATSKSFSRGETYYAEGAIEDMVIRGNRIEGSCYGSMPYAYQVSATLSEAGILSTSCTCEYDWGGDCKHIVALLLTYLYNSDEFIEREAREDSLSGRTKEQLIDLIHQMIQRHPDLQTLIDYPIPGSTVQSPADDAPMPTVNVKVFQQQLRQAFNYFGEWGDYTTERTVNEIAQVAERFADAGEYHNAVIIYCTILEEFADTEGYPVHDDGDFGITIDEIVDSLATQLHQPTVTDDDALRKQALDDMLGVYIWDIEYGGTDIGYNVPEYILEHARPEDIPEMRKTVQTLQKRKAGSQYSSWGVEAYERLLMQLDSVASTDPEETLQRLRDGEMYYLLFTKLLELNRLDEAIKVIKEYLSGTHEQLRAFQVLSMNGHDDLAVQLVEDYLKGRYERHYAHWLIIRYQERKDNEGVLRWQRITMNHEPIPHLFQQIKQTAQALGTWETVRVDVLKQLEKNKHFHTLTLIYLDEKEWELAWQTLPRVQGSSPYWIDESIDLTVASKTRSAYPERALPIYIKHVHQEIDRRDRSHYAVAAQLLQDVEEIYQQLDDEQGWDKLIQEIRSEYKRLPALQDELNKARL